MVSLFKISIIAVAVVALCGGVPAVWSKAQDVGLSIGLVASNDPFDQWVLAIQKRYRCFRSESDFRAKMAELKLFFQQEGLDPSKIDVKPPVCAA